VPESQKLKVVG